MGLMQGRTLFEDLRYENREAIIDLNKYAIILADASRPMLRINHMATLANPFLTTTVKTSIKNAFL